VLAGRFVVGGEPFSSGSSPISDELQEVKINRTMRTSGRKRGFMAFIINLPHVPNIKLKSELINLDKVLSVRPLPILSIQSDWRKHYVWFESMNH